MAHRGRAGRENICRRGGAGGAGAAPRRCCVGCTPGHDQQSGPQDWQAERRTPHRDVEQRRNSHTWVSVPRRPLVVRRPRSVRRGIGAGARHGWTPGVRRPRNIRRSIGRSIEARAYRARIPGVWRPRSIRRGIGALLGWFKVPLSMLSDALSHFLGRDRIHHSLCS